jgi:hypothetical protein
MEYVITTNQPFEAIEALATEALEQQGFEVECTFSLHSVAGVGRGSLKTGPGYSVLMIYAPGIEHQPLGLVTIYERGEQTVIRPMLKLPTSKQSPPEVGDGGADAELVAALALGGLDFRASIGYIGPGDDSSRRRCDE